MGNNSLTAMNFKNVILKDDHRDWGGISCVSETLEDFMTEVNLPMNTPILIVAEALRESGIVPVAFPLEYKRNCYDRLCRVLTDYEQEGEQEDSYTCLAEAIGDVTAFLDHKDAKAFMSRYLCENIDVKEAYEIGVTLQNALCEAYGF